MAYKLRPHQQTAINKARESFLNGNKHICLCACVASGKTLVAKTIIDSAIAKGKKVSFFSFRKILISQLKSYFDEVPNVTIDTLQKMGKNPTEKYDLAIFDEKDFHNTKLKNNITCERSITLSGSPIDASGNALDFDEIIDIIQIPDLIKIGLAKPIKVLSNSLADTSKLKKQAGDFKTKEAYDLMEKPKIKKGLIDTYKKYASDRITILFAVDTNHAESLKTEFLAAGIKCDTTHSKKDEAGRIAFENGEIKLL